MKILLVYPAYPKTYWSFHYALKFVSKKAAFPPLGLMTIAAMLPDTWEKKLVDINVTVLKDSDIKWADYVFISAMVVQKESVRHVLDRCKNLGAKVVAGGPLFTTEYKEYTDVDHLLLGEGEITLPAFLEDLRAKNTRQIYKTDDWADIAKTPVPLWEIIDMKKYVSMNIQYSRGCPYNCDFCNITLLYGRRPRTKGAEQVLNELKSLYSSGWRGGVFFVDDNFIGNKRALKENILPAVAKWMEEKNYPFTFFTEASIDLSDDEELMSLMISAGFNAVFVGIETTHEESLVECNKYQNRNRDILTSIKKIQSAGMQVQGGFIVGFDNDPANIFEKMIGFIQESGIVTAMVGLLNAPRGTKLYQRLQMEGRLLKEITGDNTDFSINFTPKMNHDKLMKGYKKVISTIYSPKHYHERVKKFMSDFRPLRKNANQLKFNEILAFFKSVLVLGIVDKERFYYWKLLIWSVFRRPDIFPMAVQFSIYGFHFRKVYELD